MTTLSALVVVGALVGILALILRSPGAAHRGEGGESRAWSLRRAGRGHSIRGYLAVETLALISAVQLGIELGLLGGPEWVPGLVAALLIAQGGLVLAPVATMTVLAFLGIAGTFMTMAQGPGPAVAITVLFVTALLTWIGGLIRGR